MGAGTKVVTQRVRKRGAKRDTRSLGVAISHGNGKDVRRDTVDH